ncbi:conjugal transfer protein TraD [Flavobacterium sp. DGU11]|uniref:Conjugal transfer protein TraD n=1 Tax=Flavobacterium arundinis TaxID=3139143 RepID=A0ABU9HUQ3_9FLAO
METIIICLLVVAVALLIYVIVQGKKGNNSLLQKEKPMAGLPDIVGRPKGTPSYSSPSTNTQSKMESVIGATDNFVTRNEAAAQAAKISQEEPDKANAEPDWREEEEEMRNYGALGTENGFALGITFDELITVQAMLGRKELEPAEEKEAIAIVSKIDGTELLSLLESKIGETSRKIAMLLDKGFVDEI